MKPRQPFNDADFQVMAEALAEFTALLIDERRVHRLTVLRRRLTEFGDDLRNIRQNKERYEAAEAERRAREPELRQQAEKLAWETFLATHPLDDPGPWVIFMPDQNFDLHGGSHGPTYHSVVAGPWREAAAVAWKAAKGLLGEPEVRKA